MSLVRFLRGAVPRSNPASPWVLQRRHVEGGPWFVVDRLGSQESVADWVLSPTVALDHGDLVKLLSPSGKVRGFWAQGLSGLVSAGRVPSRLGDHDWDWEAAWEGPQAEAEAMLRESTAVDRKRLVGAACDCAETALQHVPPGETRPREAIEVARRWMRGEASPEEVKRAADAAVDAADADTPEAAFAAAYAADTVTNATATAATRAAAHAARDAAAHAARGAAAAAIAARRALAPLVRRWIPLSTALLARAGEPTPLYLSDASRV